MEKHRKVARLEAIRDLRGLDFSVEETRKLLEAMDGPGSTIDQSLRDKVLEKRDPLTGVENRLNRAMPNRLKSG